MTNVTFVTGNQNKADYLSKCLELPLSHLRINLDEIQSLDLHSVVEHKLRQAYHKVKQPVLVEDVSLEFEALGRLPGTFIKFYIEEVSLETICRTLDSLSRIATARSMYGYYDGKAMEFFDSSLKGKISDHPKGNRGWGWDKIFIPDGFSLTRAELNEEDDMKTYMMIKPIQQLKAFLDNKKSNLI